jgi:hypothetical protein
MLSDFISYVVVIVSIPKDIKQAFETQQHKYLSVPGFIFVYPADPTRLGIDTSHLSATACGWP